MYNIKNYENLLGMDGFSDKALNTHWTLYAGYVKNINSILEKFSNGSLTHDSIEGGEVKRRLGWEYNGMKLHEIYFESLSKNPINLNTESSLAKAINEAYGSYEDWLNNTFQKIASMRGIGWTALIKTEEGKLLTVWFEEHNTGILANSKIILCIDMLEHAFLIDYGTDKQSYIKAFCKNINWKVCEERFANK